MDGASTGVYQTLALFNFGILNFMLFLGFMFFQVGACRAKNSTAIIASQTIMFALVILMFFFFSHQIIYGSGAPEKYLSQLLAKALKIPLSKPPETSYHPLSAGFFQLFLPIIGLSVVASAMAERLKLWSYIIFSATYILIIYPVSAACQWGQGFLQHLGFIDYAGGASVYMLAGIVGLTGSVIMGPRIDKYDGHKPNIIHPSHLPLMSLGAFFIWLGSVGFNSGVHALGEPLISNQNFQFVLVNTFCIGSASIVSAAVTTRLAFGAVDITFIFNGLFCALAALSANPFIPIPYITVILGIFCGLLSTPVCLLVDKLQIDDPCGMASVVVYGALLGLLSNSFTDLKGLEHSFHQFMIQSAGIVLTITWGIVASILSFILIRFIMGLRVSAEVEAHGLDFYDCKMTAYPKFRDSYK